MELVARQFMRAVRAHRSQVAFSRWLGYSSNPVAEWEAGRRFPTIGEALRSCERTKIDVLAGFEAFRTGTQPPLTEVSDGGVAVWLDALRGERSVGDVAQEAELSRYVVGRWLGGQTRPRLPQFLHLVEVLTGRVDDWVASLVDIDAVPVLSARYHALRTAARLAFEDPWTNPILRLMRTQAYRGLPAHEEGWFARCLGISLEEEARCLSVLESEGVIVLRNGRYQTQYRGRATIRLRGTEEEVRAMKAHWVDAGRDLLGQGREGDWFSFNVVSVSKEGLEQIRELHRQYFLAIQDVVKTTGNPEVAALVNIQLMAFEP